MLYNDVRHGLATHNAEEKTDPTAEDELYISDNADSWIGKKVSVGNLLAAAAASSTLVCTTAQGSSGASNGSGTWAKLATITGETATHDVNLILAVSGSFTSANASALISVYVKINSGTNPTANVQLISRTGTLLSRDSFKLINNGFGTGTELWVRKDANYGKLAVYQLAVNVFGSITVTYHNNAAWQSATPAGTGSNVSSAGLTTGDTPVATVSTAAPASATATGSVGQIAVSGGYVYVCVGANSWQRAALASW